MKNHIKDVNIKKSSIIEEKSNISLTKDGLCDTKDTIKDVSIKNTNTSAFNDKTCLVKNTRSVWIDDGKFIGICFMLLAHNYYKDWNILNFIFAFTMPLFFYLSGAVWKARGFIQSVKHSFKTIIVPYFFLYIITYLIYNDNYIKYIRWLIKRRGEFAFHKVEIIKAIMGVFIGSTTKYSEFVIFTMWFLLCLFSCRVIEAAIDSLLARIVQIKKAKIASLISACIAVIFALIAIFLPANLPWQIQATMRGFIYFVAGVETRNLMNRLFIWTRQRLCHRIIMLCTFALSFIGTFMLSHLTGWSDFYTKVYGALFPLEYIVAFCGIIMVISFTFAFTLHRWTHFFSYNTIIIIPFHLFYAMPLAIRVQEEFIEGYSFRQCSLIDGLRTMLIVLLICIIPIFIITRFFPQIIARRHPRKKA